nr:hypothetical protein [Gluconacetobacter dulcium]
MDDTRRRRRRMRHMRLRYMALVPGDPGLKHTNLFAHLTLHIPHFAPQRRNFIVSGRRLGKAGQADNRHHGCHKKQMPCFQ